MKSQLIRIVLSKDGSKKTIMKLERRKHSEFHSYCVIGTHVTYHTRGRSHVELGKWSSSHPRQYYRNIVFNHSPKIIKGVKILHAMLMCYPKTQIESHVRFPDYSEKPSTKEIIKSIDESVASPGDLLLVVSGLASDENEIDLLVAKFYKSSSLQILYTEKQLSQTDPHIFIVVVTASGDDKNTIIEIDQCLGLGFKNHPENRIWLSENGNKPHSSITIKLDTAIPMALLYPTPPEFIFHPSIDDPVYNVTLESTPYQSKWVEVGKIAIKNYHFIKLGMVIVLVAERAQIENSWSIMFCNSHFGTSIKYTAIDFRITYGGHLVKQVKIADTLYQFEYEHSETEKLDSLRHLWESTPLNQLSNISKHTVGLKIIEIQYKPENISTPQSDQALKLGSE